MRVPSQIQSRGGKRGGWGTEDETFSFKQIPGAFASLLSTLSNISQQMVQELVSNRIQIMILEKADTLDLSFFENPEFYDKMRQATDQSTYKPVSIISQTFDL